MGQPSTIAGYESEWSIIAHYLTKNTSLTLPVGNAKAAAKLRFRFYGFRKAMSKHDPANPWLAALMETQATVTPEGNVHFERAPFAVVLRGLLEHSQITQPHESVEVNTATASSSDAPVEGQVTQMGHEETILSILTHKKAE